MRKLTILAAALALSGCASTHLLDNRVACTAAKDQLVLVSWWGWFGIAAKGTDDDRKVICEPKG